MRIKAVLRDTDILQLEAGSKERILAAAKKNADRVINWPSLLKVMGLVFEDRTKMLDSLAESKLKIWLLTEGGQHLIFLTTGKDLPQEDAGYQWQ
ncbi:MAG: hypothetical protein RTV72_15055 [Candidatus Thorarchaeota archaeon]